MRAIRSCQHAIIACSRARMLAAVGAAAVSLAAAAAFGPGAPAALAAPPWRGEPVAATKTTFSAVSIAADGDGLNIAVQGPANRLDFYWQLNGTTPWHPQLIAGTGSTYSAPAITGSDDSANVVAEGPDNFLDYYWQHNGTRAWHLRHVKGPGVFDAPAITADSNGVDVVAPGPGDTLTSYSDTSGSWQSEDIHGTCEFCGVGVAGSDATVTVNDGSENVAVFRAVTADLDLYWQDSSGDFQKEIVAFGGVN